VPTPHGPRDWTKLQTAPVKVGPNEGMLSAKIVPLDRDADFVHIANNGRIRLLVHATHVAKLRNQDSSRLITNVC